MATGVRVVERRRRYHWPEAQLNFWLLIMITASATTLGIFAYFITVQHTLKVGIPWLVFPPAPPMRGDGAPFVSRRRRRLCVPPPPPPPPSLG